MKKTNTMLTRMVKNSKSQYIAVLVIIIVGVMFYTAMNMTSINLKSTAIDYYDANNFPDLFVECTTVQEQNLAELRAIPGVEQAYGRIVTKVPLVSGNEKERVHLQLSSTTTTSEEDDINELAKNTVIDGDYIRKGSHEVLVIEQFAHARNITIGETITIQAAGKQYSLEVAGIVSNPEFIYLMESADTILSDPTKYGVCYVSAEFAQQITGFANSYNNVVLSYDGTGNEEDIIDDIEKILKNCGIKQIVKAKDQLSNNMYNEELEQLKTMSDSVPLIFLFVAGLVLTMMLGRMVKKDRMKIGVMKALGYSNLEVLMHYVKYASSAGFIGGALGASLGMGLSRTLTIYYLNFYSIPMLVAEFNVSYVCMAILLSTLLCTVAGVFGARKTLKISPADSMSVPSPRAGKRIFLERIRFFWKSLSFSGKMVWKNVFRNKKRSAFVVVGVLLSYGMMLFTTTMPQVMDDFMNKYFEEFQTMDYNINFNTPLKSSSVDDIESLVDTQRLEPKIEYPFTLINGNKEQAVMVIGLQENSQFFFFKNLKDKPVTIERDGIYLSENLANNLGIAKGDMLQIKNYLPGHDDVYLQVREVLKQSLGMNAYMDIDYMGETLLEKNMATGAYADSGDEEFVEKLIYASNISSIMSTQDTRNAYLQFMTMIRVAIGAMVVFSGILGFCVVYNATIISIGEREMEFSSLRVLGMGKDEIFAMILKENTIVSIIGMILGVPFGILVTKYSSDAFASNLYTISVNPSLAAYFYAAALTMLFIVIAQFATYQKIKRLDFLQALKNRAS